MKKRDIYSLGIIFIIFAFSWLNIFIVFFNQYTLIIFIGILILISYILLGCEKKKSIIEKDIILSIFAYLILYYLITYVLGFFTGFYKNLYSLKFINILKNISPVILTIIAGEFLRYLIIHRTRVNKLIIITSFISFVFLSNTLIINEIISKNVVSATIIQRLGLFILPNVTTNILMTYLAINIGLKTQIIYRLLIELPLYILPIFPKFGDYIESVLRISLPVIVFIAVYRSVTKNKIKSIVIIEKKKLIGAFGINVLLFCIILVYFISGKFRFKALVIATGSMTPNINIGDIVLVDELKGDRELQVGDVIAYKKGNIVICHRVINIVTTNDTRYFETKGDANSTPDQLLVEEENIVGVVKAKINYIGYPTVMLNQIMK